MARKRYGKKRLAFDRSVRAALANENAEQRLDAELDAALIAAGRGIADHIDGLDAEFEKTLEHTREVLNNSTDTLALARALEALDKIAQRVDKATYLTPHLMNILREMYATPKTRVEAKRLKEKTSEGVKSAADKGGKVAKFRGVTGVA